MRILVIEDDPTVGQYVKRGLEEHRWAVDLVVDGEEGEHRRDQKSMIDHSRHGLPGKSGLEVCTPYAKDSSARPRPRLRSRDAK